MSDSFDLVVIGAGPGGYVAAIRAAQLGFNVACIDDNRRFGGTCLRVGCIPSKALLESSERYAEAIETLSDHGIDAEVELDLPKMMARKEEIVDGLTGGIDMLFKKNKVTKIVGRGRLLGGGKVEVKHGDEERVVEGRRILIATGSRPASLRGVEEDGDRIGNSTAALSWSEVPKRLVVIGAGYIGMELGSVWRRLGSEVIVLEALDRVLPGMDQELSRLAKRAFEKQGFEFRLQTFVKSAKVDGDRCLVELQEGEPIEADRVLVATGRVPVTNLGLEEAGVKTDERGFVVVGDDFSTSAEGVYAIGDCIGGAMLAHKASHEGVACIERMTGRAAHVDYDAIPAVVYTHPEIASVGRTEEQLKEAGIEYRKGFCPYGASGRARALGDINGKVKVLADAGTDRVLGVHVIGLRAGDLIAEAAAAMSFGASAEDITHVVHAHPTLSEVLHEAALAVDGRAIHT